MRHVWQRHFYDFIVFTEKKRVEKLRYMHRNPVQRGLVLEPEEWLWSSFRHYAYGEPPDQFWSMRPEKRSFTSAKFSEPIGIVAHP